MDNPEPSIPKVYKVAIIGAGISGISAARHLIKSGIENILIIEATNKAGGRIDTREFGQGIVELGAQWIHGEQNEFCQLIKSSGHRHEKTSWEGKGPFLCPSGEQIEGNVVDEVLGWLEDTIEKVEQSFTIDSLHSVERNGPAAAAGNKSMGSYLIEEFFQYMEDVHPKLRKDSKEYSTRMALFQWGMSFQRIDNSCQKMNDVSLFRWSEFEVNPGEHYNNFKMGGQQFVDKVLLGDYVSEDTVLRSKLKLSSPVKNIEWQNESVKVTVEGSEGEYFVFAETVLVTVSIAVLKSNLESLFTPNLPLILEQAIKSTGFGPVTKIFLEWEKPWWPSDLQGYQFVWPEEFIDCCSGDDGKGNSPGSNWPKAITGFDPVLENPNVLLGWMGGSEAIYVEGLSDEEVGRKCQDILKLFTGEDVPKPKSVIVSKWNTNKFFQGAYSFRSIEGDDVSGDICSVLCEPVMTETTHGNKKPVIVLAGEACSKTHYSTLHGAYESGQAQATKLIQYFANSTNSSTPSTAATAAAIPSPLSNTAKHLKQPCQSECITNDSQYLTHTSACSVKN